MATVFEAECSRAQTWVLTLSRTDPLQMTKLNGWALSNDVLFGMHTGSGTVILAMSKAETQQNMLDKVRTMMKHGWRSSDLGCGEAPGRLPLGAMGLHRWRQNPQAAHRGAPDRHLRGV